MPRHPDDCICSDCLRIMRMAFEAARAQSAVSAAPAVELPPSPCTPSPTTAAREGIIAEVSRCVLRDRNATHGNSEDNFKVIAELMSAFLRGRGLLPSGREITSEDVAILSALIKVGRLAGNLEHPDNWVDGAGYFVCGGGIAATRKSHLGTG